jgi:adenosylmethionine-8-amino-7-oxononanoate aminotransferase
VTSEKIYRAFLGKYRDLKTFFHGHTYTGNQLACVAAIANLNLFKKERTIFKAQSRIALMKKGLDKMMDFQHVGEIRQRGFMIGIELVRDKSKRTPYPLEDKIGWRVCARAIEKGLMIRPLGNVVVLMPPLNISRQEINSLVRITAEAIREVTES